MSLGERIALARTAVGMSKAELARRVGKDTKTVYRWEHDEAQPESASIAPIADATGVSVRWLLTGEGDGPADAASLKPTGTED